MSKPPSILWACAVWGDSHTRMFLDYHLPSLFHPSNLPAMREVAPVRGMIYTDAKTLEKITPALKAAASAAGMEDRIEATIISVPRDGEYGGHVMSRMQAEAAKLVTARGEALCWTFPDAVTSANSYSHVAKLVRWGARACLWQGPTMRVEAAEPFKATGSAWAEVPRDDLLRATLNGLHPITASRVWPCRIGWPSIIHKVGPDWMTTRTFHSNPIYIFPRKFREWGNSLDGSYIETTDVADAEIIRMVEPDGFFWVEVAEDSKRERQGQEQTWTEASLANWAETTVTATNRREFQYVYRMGVNAP